jgi:toxin-antitoxin system PIN domain toxin
MILVDANLLIYAIDRDSPHHARARGWLEETLSGDTRVGLPWVVILAFIRLTTRSGIVRNPLRPDQALAFVDSWLRQPYVTAVGPGEHHWRILSNLLRASGTAGNLTSDAHIASLALEWGDTVASADSDFRRFSGVTLVNPLDA